MKKNLFICCLCLLMPAILFAHGSTETSSNVVVVYAYDSFTAEWGPGPELEKRFEAETGYDLQFVTFDDAGPVLSQAILEGENCRADVLIGIDNFLFDKAKQANILQPYKSKNAHLIKAGIVFDPSYLVTPYDYGYFTFMYDTESKLPAPTCLDDLLKPNAKKSVIIMDPRTSTPGLGFLAWTQAVYGNEYTEYWKKLKSSLLTMAPGWSTGYGMFTAGEAPLALSYTSSEAYHVLYDKTDRYKALIFSDGHIRQVETMGLLKTAPNATGGKAFIDFMLSEQAQSVLPETQWMYPVTNIRLPNSYNGIIEPGKVLNFNSGDMTESINTVINIIK